MKPYLTTEGQDMPLLTIRFAPVRRDGTLTLDRQGDLLIANGETYDLTALATAQPDSPGDGWVQSVQVTDTGLEAVVALPHGADAPETVRFPQPITVEENGPVTLPG